MGMNQDDPTLDSELIARVLLKLGLPQPPSRDLAGLNAVYAAWSSHISFDNVQKRIWFTGSRATPITGGDPVEFFENWLTHGTGGTCWPTSGAMYALARSLGFDARRIAGAMIEPGEVDADPAGHGTVLVTLDGVDYLVDASMLAFEALPLVSGVPASAGAGIHAIRAVPTANGFDVLWHPGHLRKAPVTFRTHPEYDRVNQAFFSEGYERSRIGGPFNDALYICRRHAGSIRSIGRHKRIGVSTDGTVTTTALSDIERKRLLVEEFKLSEEIVAVIPPDVERD